MKGAFWSSARWRKLRKMKLECDPLCEHCLKKDRMTVATDVDHIQRLNDYWDLRLDWDNLQSLCKPCHGRKTYKETNPQVRKNMKFRDEMDEFMESILRETLD